MPESDSTYLKMDNARTNEQKKLMNKIRVAGVCPFCSEHFIKYHPRPIIEESDFWFFTENMSPYDHTKYHFIFVYKPAHITTPGEMMLGAAEDLFRLVSFSVEKYKIPGGSFFMRFGDMKYNGSSVNHLHAQLLMGNADIKNHEPVRVKLG